MNYLEQMWRDIDRTKKVCFFSGLFWGFLTHMYMLTNKLPNWDDLTNFGFYGVGSEFGRFMLKPLDRLTLVYSNPWVNGTVTVVLIAMVCVFLYDILGFKSTLAGVLLPMVVMTFPGLTSTMTFMFTADLYAAGIFLAVLAAYIVIKKKHVLWGIPAAFCMVISMGIYQSYICFTITLVLLHLLKELLETDADENTVAPVKKQFCRGVLYAGFLAVSTVLYIIAAHLRYPGLGKENYNGVGAMGSVSVVRLPRLIAKAYLRFARYFVLGDFSFISKPFQIWNILVILCMAVIWVLLLYRIRKDKLRVLFAVFVTMLLPLGNSFVDVMAPDASFSMLMLYQYCLVYVAALRLAECLSEMDKRVFAGGLSIAVILLICMVGYKQYQLAGEAYFRMDIAYRRSYAYLQRILVHVEEQDAYRQGDPIRILGSFDGDYSSFQNMSGKKYLDLSGTALEYGMLTPGSREKFAGIYLGVKLEDSNGDEAEKIKNGEEYKSMECYPSAQSIRQIDGCWTVKLSE